MARFHPLTVTDIARITRDAVALTLAPEPEAAPAFAFAPGQYLTFRRDFAGTELRRAYSICAAPGEPLRVGIKRVEGGAFSTWANTELRVGDRIEAMAPAGGFFAPFGDPGPRGYLAFAGGSGITPILSILKATLAGEPASRFTLVYANRGAGSIMFREEIEDLKNRYLERLSVLHVLETDAQEIDLFTGIVDARKCALLFRHWIDLERIHTAYICGPEPMMLGISQALGEHGMARERIRFELFTLPQPGSARAPAQAPGPAVAQTPDSTLTLTLDGTSRTLAAPRDVSILDTARAHDIDVPFACKAGVCSTCRCQVLEGEVEMIANHALEDYEVEKGHILSCQSYPLSERIVVNYDL